MEISHIESYTRPKLKSVKHRSDPPHVLWVFPQMTAARTAAARLTKYSKPHKLQKMSKEEYKSHQIRKQMRPNVKYAAGLPCT